MADAGLNLHSFSVRACLLTLLLVAEVLLLQMQLDSETVTLDTSVATWILTHAYLSVRYSIAFGLAFLFFAGSRLVRIRKTLAAVSRSYRWNRWLVFHLIAYSLFARFSFIVFREGAATPFRSVVWVLLVFVVGISWALSWSSWQHWIRAFQPEIGTLAIAGVTALIVCTLGSTTNSLWGLLAPYTMWASYALLACVFDEVVCDAGEHILGANNFSVHIYPPCSGYEGIGIVTIFLTVYILVYRSQLKLPNAYLLLILGIVASWCGNVIRIAVLIAIGASISPNLAVGGFHSQAGWLLICTITLCLVAVSRRVQFFASEEAPFESLPAGTSHTDAYLMPLLVGIASGMLAEAVGLDGSRAYAVRACLLFVTLLWYRPIYLKMPRHRSWWSAGFGLTVFLLWSLLVTPPDSNSSLTLAPSIQSNNVWFLWRCVWYVGLIPIAEELAFRKYLIDRLRSYSFGWAESYKIWIAVGVSSICFGLLHGAHWAPGIAAGLLFGAAYVRRGSLLDAVLAHAVCNGAIAAYATWTESWWLWG